jgi:hypothetical protein
MTFLNGSAEFVKMIPRKIMSIKISIKNQRIFQKNNMNMKHARRGSLQKSIIFFKEE